MSGCATHSGSVVKFYKRCSCCSRPRLFPNYFEQSCFSFFGIVLLYDNLVLDVLRCLVCQFLSALKINETSYMHS